MKDLLASIDKNLNTIVLVVLCGAAVLLPLILFPLSDNFLLTSKFYFLFLATFIMCICWALFTLTKKSVQFTLSPFVAPLLIFIIATAASILFNNTYIVNQLMGYGGLYIGLSLLVILGSSILVNKDSKILLDVMVIPGLVLSFATAAELLGWGPSRVVNILLGTQFPATPIFSLSGSPLIALEFLAMAVGGIIMTFFLQRKRLTPFHLISAIIMIVAIGINAYTLYQAQKTTPVFLPYSVNWAIAIDSLKSLKTFVLGFGPDNFGEVYLGLKPAAVNTTRLWSVQFIQGSNLPFSLISTVGLLGLASWIWLVIQALKGFMKQSEAALPAAAVFLSGVVLELFLPPNAVVLGIQAIALVFWVAAERHRLQDVQLHTFTVHLVKSDAGAQRVPHHSNLMVYTVTALSGVLVLVSTYFLGRAMVGEYLIFQGELAALHNQAVPLYNLQQQAIVANKYLDTYRRKYSATNMSIAIALANSPAATDTDKQKVIGLIQQSIQEAKAAIVLDEKNSLNWLTLARIYANLIGVADGADQAAVNSYVQAIALAPNDPIVRLELGGVLFRTGKYEQAAQVFEQLAGLKPDWPNVYYNLALTYRQRQQYNQAYAAYQQTLSLLGSDNADYGRVKNEMDDFLRSVQKPGSQPAQPTTQRQTNTSAAQQAASASALLAPTATASTPAELKTKAARESLSRPLPSPSL